MAQLYDRFANALDPEGPGRDLAEEEFERELADAMNWLASDRCAAFRGIDITTFKRAVVLRCRRFLKAEVKERKS